MSRSRTEGAFATLKRSGVSALVVLTEQSPRAESVKKFDLRIVHVPIVDFAAPSLVQIKQTLTAIDDFITHGLAVGVHCEAGLGRTGTILAGYLVSLGASANDAIAKVRARRPGSIEIPEQEASVRFYEIGLGWRRG